jgi:uncharacterized protein YegL
MPLHPGQLASRPLHFIWICDVSGSMSHKAKISSLNTAIREAIPLMQQEADGNPNAEVLVRVIKFASGAQWHIAEPTPIQDFRWTDLTADGVTDMGKALTMVADQLKTPPMNDRALPPVLVLISDGHPTDDFNSGTVGQKSCADRDRHWCRCQLRTIAKIYWQLGNSPAPSK